MHLDAVQRQGVQMWSNTLNYTPGQFYQYQQPYLVVAASTAGMRWSPVNLRIGVWRTPR